MTKKIPFINLFIWLIISAYPCYSQEESKIPLTYRATLIGRGKSTAYDSYLSPLKYSGWNIGWIEEQIKMTSLLSGNVSAQHLLNVEIALTENPTKTATDYVGNAEYNYGLHYHFRPVRNIQLLAGAQAGGRLGFVYNSRNGNNPINTKIDIGLNLSGMAIYRFEIQKQPVHIRYQLNLPFAGLVFSPEYGQSYYEIGLEAGENTFHFASFHNRMAIRNLLSIELPLNACTIRLTYMNWLYETQINYLDTHLSSNSIYIGFSRNFFSLSGRKHNKNKYRYVFE